MPDGLYDQDVLLWAERQADLLRRLQAGERVNESIDWDNLIEEIEDVGRSELHSCESNLEQAMKHLLKLALLPGSPDVPHWRGETRTFLNNASRHYTRAMRQRIDMPELFRGALDAVEEQIAGSRRLTVTERALLALAACPFVLEDLMPPKPTRPDLDVLLARLTDLIPTAPPPP